MRKTSVAAGAAMAAALNAAELPSDRIYPEGSRFPLVLYSIHTVEEMKEVEPTGWAVGHRYNFADDFFETVEQAGWMCVAHLRGKTKSTPATTPAAGDTNATQGAANAEEAGRTAHEVKPAERLRTEEEVAGDITRYADHGCVAWWDFPEEQRWWREDEYAIVKNLSAWTRKHDPKQRPNYMYLPGHYSAEAVAKYVQYLDIIGAGTYTEYAHQQRAWVRWRTEETIRGIRQAGCRIGPDYLRGEKTPIGIPMLFGGDFGKMDPISPVGAYHDFWSCLASGARGIFLFSFWHRRDLPMFRKTWEDGYNRAARDLNRDPRLPQALLFGKTVPLAVTVTKGSPRTATFRPYGIEEDLSLPSVNVLAKRHRGTLYVIAVSSQERPVTARISGLPEGVERLEVVTREEAGDEDEETVAVTNGAFEQRFPWLTVRVYRTALPEAHEQ